MCLAIPGQIVEVLDEDNQLAQVDVAGVRRTVNVSLLGAGPGAGPPAPGQWVLIHVGFALSRIDEREAHATLQLLREAGAELDQAIDELRGSAIG